MKHLRILTLATALTLSLAAVAQEAGFDLASQRKEKSDVLPVPGQQADHHGLIINPTPQKMTLDPRGGTLDVTRGYSVSGALAEEADFLPRTAKGARVTISSGKAVKGMKAGAGAYRLSITPAGIRIDARDETGAYYALQTLRQIVASEAAREGRLPLLTIDDAPALPVRGVVEGFYGTPWSHQVRLSLIEFMGRNKLNTYVYGPKDDPYHSSPNWRKAYPEAEAQNIHELVSAAKRNRVEFVWGIHPGKDIRWNEEDYQNLVHKFDLMYGLGVRAFAIHFDDIEGEGTNPVKQVELLNRITREWVRAKGDVAPLIVCPTDYSQLWANATEQGTLAIYGRTLDPSIRVFWTGAVVCSDLTRETLQFIDSRTRRPALYWWNFPVTDYARHIVMQGPTYGLDTTLTASEVCGVLTNPMEYGEASKLSLYGVADYTWNVAAYNALDNWERALGVVTPEAREAYRTFAIHSCDTETGYRRDESWETPTFRLADYTEARYTALSDQLRHAAAAPATLRSDCRNGQLIRELSPWLREFSALVERDTKALEMMRTYQQGAETGTVWTAYTGNLMDDAALTAYSAHKSGTMRLQPFYENAMEDIAAALYRRITGRISTACHPIGSYPTLADGQAKRMLDGDTGTYYHSNASQETGQWIGLDLGSLREVADLEILQGRNSVDDVDFFDRCIVEYSADGKQWTALTGELAGTYEIRWQGTPVKARYVRMRKLQTEKKSWCAVREFRVNTAISPALDGNLATRVRSYGVFAYQPGEGAKACDLFLRVAAGDRVHVVQRDRQGRTLADQTHDTSYIHVDLLPGATTVEIVGEADIYEII